jgi:hypothetical protein
MRIESNLFLKGILKLINVAEASSFPYQLVIDSAGTVKKYPNESSLPVYQIADIYDNYTGNIPLNNFVGNELGSYNCHLEAQFAELSNGSYRLAAQRIVDFSFIAYQSGIAVVHSEPTLHISAHSGTVVRLSDNTVFDLQPNDITFQTTLSGSKLVVQIKNNLPSPYTGSIRCRYSLKVTKWNWQSGGGELNTE